MSLKFPTMAIILAEVITASAHASTIVIASQPGLPNSLTAATVTITPHPYWQQNHPENPWAPGDTSAVWISYALTGYGDSGFQPSHGTTPVMSVFHDFTSGAGTLNLRVWADDTAGVFLDGISLFDPAFTQNVCSGQPIGCRPEDFATISTTFVAGTHQLEFRVYQVGTGTDSSANPFGLLYTGAATSNSNFDTANVSPTPEPGTWVLAGSVLAIVAVLKMRQSRQL